MVNKNKLTNIEIELDSGEEFSLGTKHEEIAETIVGFSEGTLELDCDKPQEFNEQIDEKMTVRILDKIEEENIALPGGFETDDVRLISFNTN